MTTPAPAPADFQVRHLDPRTLLVDRNLRTDPALTPDFVGSIRDHGVLIPIVAVEADDGVRVRYGQRRTLAAVEAGRPTVPVVVIGPDADDRATEIDRLVTQWAENEQRAGLTDRDRLAGVEQLAAFGLSAADISRRTRTPRPRVEAALTVAASPLARDAAGRHDFLDLTQAAVLAEFAGDDKAVETLLSAARHGGFDHTAQRLRDRRADRAEQARATEALTAQGVRVVDQPAHTDAARHLAQLDHDGTPLTPETHAACPGHAAYLVAGYEPAGAPDGDDGDGNEDGDGDGDGASPGYQRVFQPRYVCTDPDAHGHVDRYPPPAGTGPGRPAGPLSEQDKAERREVIENNKAWRSATTVRREWLRTFAARRAAPRGAGRFAAACLAAGDHELRRALERGHPAARDLLGRKDTPLTAAQLADLIEKATEPRAQVLTLAVVLAAYEDTLDVPAWRRPSPAARRYLAALETWGYTLSDVERLAVDPPGAASGGHDADAADERDPETATGRHHPAPAARDGRTG
jgi:ParB family chromosome partitioning protein